MATGYGDVTLSQYAGDSISLQDGVNYAITEDGWAPGMARFRSARLGNMPPVHDVEVQIVVNVFGASALIVQQKVKRIVDIIARAERWMNGGGGYPVCIKWSPQGQTTEWFAQVVSGVVEMPGSYLDEAGTLSTKITIRLIRRGTWLKAEIYANVAGGYTPNSIYAWSFSGAPFSDVSTVTLLNTSWLNHALPTFGLHPTIAIANQNTIKKYLHTTATTSSGTTNSAGSYATLSDSGSMRGLNFGESITWASASAMMTGLTNKKRFAVFAQICPDSATPASVQIEARYACAGIAQQSRMVFTTWGKPTYLGTFDNLYIGDYLTIVNQSSMKAYVDWVIIVLLDDDMASIIDYVPTPTTLQDQAARVEQLNNGVIPEADLPYPFAYTRTQNLSNLNKSYAQAAIGDLYIRTTGQFDIVVMRNAGQYPNPAGSGGTPKLDLNITMCPGEIFPV